MIKLSSTQRILLTAGSAVGALINPLRGDLVATLGKLFKVKSTKCLQQSTWDYNIV